ncbi:MAG: iron ABC transporter permease [Armatimonadota bacterium]|nr:iron ABC transporter permease [Armatimonadota bacterium]MDR7471274.1 iron ABC transporter permease [Armatimonadota bacterium]
MQAHVLSIGETMRWVYRFRRARSEPAVALGWVLVAVLVYLVLVPVAAILADAVRVQYGDEGRTGAEVGTLTGYYLSRVFASRIAAVLFWTPLTHTLLTGLGVTILAVCTGAVLGWLLAHRDLPGRASFATALIMPYMMPSWTLAVAWLRVFKNRTVAGAPGYLESIGIVVPDWLAYGAVPIVVTLGAHYIPFAMLLVKNALERFDWRLVEAAEVLGADRWTRLRRVVIPLLIPSIVSAAVLTMAKAVGSFGTPYLLGLPVNYRVLATSLYQSGHMGDTGTMAVLAAVIMALGIVLVLADGRLSRGPQRFAVVSGGSSGAAKLTLGRWRYIGAAACAVVFLVFVVLPLAVLALSTVTRVPGRFSLDNFTLVYWIGTTTGHVGHQAGLLRSPDLWQAAWNSLKIVGTASVLAGITGLLIGYVNVRAHAGVAARLLRQVAFVPYLIPGIALGAAFLSWFGVRRGVVPALYGSDSLLVLALLVASLPVSSRAGMAAMTQIGKELEEAAQACGAGWVERWRRVMLPVGRGALVAGSVLPLLSGLRELSLVVMLAKPGLDVLTTFAIRLSDYGYVQLRDGAVLVTVIVSLLATWLVQRTIGGGLSVGRGPTSQ